MIPTEPVGSLPRSPELLTAMADHQAGRTDAGTFRQVQERAVRDTIERLEAAGPPVVTDGEQTKPDFVTYPVTGTPGLSPEGVEIPFADGRQRQLPVLTAGPFRYKASAEQYLRTAQQHTTAPVKQAVVAPSVLSLFHPPSGISGFPREEFLHQLMGESEAAIRACLDAGVHAVQLDFDEARLTLRPDPGGGVLNDLVDLNNQALSRFTESERARIGVCCGPGADQDSTHSLDVDYAELLPRLSRLTAGNFYLQLAGEADPDRVRLRLIARFSCTRRNLIDHMKNGRLFFRRAPLRNSKGGSGYSPRPSIGRRGEGAQWRSKTCWPIVSGTHAEIPWAPCPSAATVPLMRRPAARF
ncbi:5-methyltetrahydropteroyltriglutamate--homocysteine methyltransferase [Streptomyces monashensis]|uniref:5-methyltetrahydropteroyltriglutamate-- homocysteine methyltransferase n=1 Tax=Streptomyces monashensis TaxID=1678012 RepID=UPI003F540C33